MNRRSLLLGSVVASVAGILGVRAEQPITKLVTHTYSQPKPLPSISLEDAYGLVDIDQIRRQRARDMIRQSPEYQALLVKQVMKNIGDSTSGYQINQLMAHGTPPMFPEPLVITEKYAQANGLMPDLDITIDGKGYKLGATVRDPEMSAGIKRIAASLRASEQPEQPTEKLIIHRYIVPDVTRFTDS